MNIAVPGTLKLASAGTPWRRHVAALALAALSILLLFARDAAHMITIWWTSSTFNHCLLVVPIIGWLVWQRAPALASLLPATWTPGLAVVGLGAFGWLLGDAAGVSLFRHVGLVVMLQGMLATLLGKDVVRALAFPLFYLLFLVPAGEELVPALQGVTARISMALLGLAGIPAHVEGVFITTPSGYFEVAEACSGVKFLIAMFALGVLVAHLGFRHWPRRLAFMVAAIAVPVLANGVRAFATIYVAGITSTQDAAGFDHIVYGWFFFGIIIAALLGAAWRFFDRAPDAYVVVPASRNVGTVPLKVMFLLGLIIAAAPLAWASAAAARAREASVPVLSFPDVPGWSRIDRGTATPWLPRFAGADRMTAQRYRDGKGQEVDLVVAAYAWQSEGRELVGFGQGAVDPEGGWSWSEDLPPPAAGRADRIMSGGVARDVLTFYRIDDLTTGNPAGVKLATLKARLLGRSGAGAAVLLSAEAGPGASARRSIDDFLSAAGSIDLIADRALGR